jgi:hypothetical protein
LPELEKKMRYLIIFSLIFAGSVHAALLDCEKAATPIKKEVCSNKNTNGDTLNQSYANTKVQATERSKQSEEIRGLLPRKGFVFLSGGLVSYARQLVVDLETGELKYAIGKSNASSIDLTKGKVLVLTSGNKAELVKLANSIWVSSRDFTNSSPTVDFDVRLILCDDEWVKDIESYGPPVDTVDQLYTLAWGLVPK